MRRKRQQNKINIEKEHKFDYNKYIISRKCKNFEWKTRKRTYGEEKCRKKNIVILLLT